jgi:hypothetical protein
MTADRRSFFRKTVACSFAAAALFATPLSASAQSLSPAEARQIAEDAYVYGYSLITTEVTRVQGTNIAKAEPNKLGAPMNQFANVPRYPPANYRGVSAPNADTLYSLAWLDLSEPMVFSHPDMGNRFYLFEMVDLWMTDLKASPSTRTAGGNAENYLITGPGWSGDVPQGMKHISMPTRYMVILGRTYANGMAEDYKAVNALQAQYKITPLSAWGKTYTPVAPPVNPKPGFSMTAKPQEAILAMGTQGYFNLMAKLMEGDAPPAPEDAPMLARMAKIGIAPGKPFEMGKLDPAVQTALKDTPKTALKKIEANKDALGAIVDGWVVTKGLGTYGTNYIKRAVVAAFGWPANQQDDAVYPYTEVDSTGQKLTGQGWWFVPNALNKFTVSPRDNLKPNADGSVTLYFQNASPGADKEANWLPAPKGAFLPMLRMYWPKENSPSILDGSWTPPPVIKAN